MERKTVTVYVRKGAHDEERLLSFRRQDDIPTKELLDMDLAIDGNQVIFSVASNPEEGVTLSAALVQAEDCLIDFLGKYGYDVKFA